jgi:predicted GIY-YIG superfamily endonuclease
MLAFVLRLQDDKYYVGSTSQKDPNDRIKQHMNGFYSAQWVKNYKPIEIIDIGNKTPEEEASELEDHRTLQYMKRYGLQST